MSLSAWEQQVLDSIGHELEGSDPELAALLSSFTRLASDEAMPDRERVRAGSRWAAWRLRCARWRSRFRRTGGRLGVHWVLWLLTTAILAAAVLVAIALALGADGDHGTCTETVALVCTGPTPGRSPASHPSTATATATATDHASKQAAVRDSAGRPAVRSG